MADIDTHDATPLASPERLLRHALLADTAATGAVGALAAVGSGPLGELLGLPPGLLLPVGIFLLAYAALVALIGTRRRISRPAVWSVIATNGLWTVASVVLVLGGWFELTTLGTVFVLGQAAAVAAFAELQYLGLRRIR
ncbi:hypothetical protein CS0771_76630 [Catellatospora sp. IY07-71]|uniref:hypothetical protein n=1 Tax=Catellatospora sp. IY07-71 TaxID=2728827 RepID=UPI001BB34642|nr:hypothetical protein [Catellatospora sp. IY07-71]BCJ78119.1 hypothetical protein CS0771_76630 [Catellatospora sp. IY07-71]